MCCWVDKVHGTPKKQQGGGAVKSLLSGLNLRVLQQPSRTYTFMCSHAGNYARACAASVCLVPPPPAPTQPSCTNLPPPLVCRLCLLTLTWLCSMDACAHLRVIPARVLLPFGVCPSPRWRESLLSPPSPPPWGTPPFYFLQAMFVDFGMTVQYGGVCYLHLCCYLVPCASRFCPLPHK